MRSCDWAWRSLLDIGRKGNHASSGGVIDRVGEDFGGIILSCTKYGFFVELDDLFIEGLVPIASLSTWGNDEQFMFRDTDKQKEPNVAIVNQAFADKYFPGARAIGKHFWSGPREQPGTEIVGVAANTRTADLTPLLEQLEVMASHTDRAPAK